MMRLFILTLTLLTFFMAGAAQAEETSYELDSAKQNKLIGERMDGLVEAINLPAPKELEEYITHINEKRMKYYEGLAKKHNVPLNVIRASMGHNIVKVTAPGHYYKDQHGKWVRKK